MCVYARTCVYVWCAYASVHLGTGARPKPFSLANKLSFICPPPLLLSLLQIYLSELLFLNVQHIHGCLSLPSLAGSGPFLCVPQHSTLPTGKIK